MLRIKLDVLEDILSPDDIDGEDTERAHAPETLVAWWRKAMARLETHPRFASPARNPDMVKQELGREQADIHVFLCSRPSLIALSDQEKALGVHLVSTPDHDPFKEEAPYSREYRALVVSDRNEFLSYVKEEAEADYNNPRYLGEYVEAYANTVFHEIAHILLFAENANLLPPNEISNLSDAGEIDNDLFDHSTGYGMRPLEIDGKPVWADTIDEAGPLMERYVEDLGRELMAWTLHGAQYPLTLVEAMGLKDDINAIYPVEEPAL
jgi:hypothetical protein